MSAAGLSVGRAVVGDMIRFAAVEVPGVLRVGRAGPAWRRWLGGSPVEVRTAEGRASVRLWIVARPGQRLVPLVVDVRAAVGGAIERLLGLELASLTIVVDGIGA